MDNLEFYDKLKTPPPEALKEIKFGHLKGKSDINPQWRMKAMTEVFGPCGIGWKYTIDKLWTEQSPDGVVMAFSSVSVYIKHDGEWSSAIPGIGGNGMIEMAKGKLKPNDECFKMATTDALSVAFKALGVAGDVYMGMMDGSKYSRPQQPAQQQPAQQQPAPQIPAEVATWKTNVNNEFKAIKDASEFADLITSIDAKRAEYEKAGYINKAAFQTLVDGHYNRVKGNK